MQIQPPNFNTVPVMSVLKAVRAGLKNIQQRAFYTDKFQHVESRARVTEIMSDEACLPSGEILICLLASLPGPYTGQLSSDNFLGEFVLLLFGSDALVEDYEKVTRTQQKSQTLTPKLEAAKDKLLRWTRYQMPSFTLHRFR